MRLAAFVVCALKCSSPREVAAPKTYAIAINGMVFEPSHIEAKPGDTVVWTNNDLVPHTVTADDASFDSSVIAPNGKWQATLRQAGTIGYHCTLHPGMKATIRM